MCLKCLDKILVIYEIFLKQSLHVWRLDGINKRHQIAPHNIYILLAGWDVICDFELAGVGLAKSLYIKLQCAVPAGDITCDCDEIKLIIIADSL